MESWQGMDYHGPVSVYRQDVSAAARSAGNKTADATYIEFFSGAGGMSVGLKRAKMKCLLAVDINPLAVENYNNYFKEGNSIVADIMGIDKKFVEDFLEERRDCLMDLLAVVGGPPCQGFSMDGYRNVMDERNSLVGEFLRIVAEIKPRYFLMENVVGILSMLRPVEREGMPQERVVDWIGRRIKQAGYQYKMAKIHSHHYGDPQKRARVIFAGWRNGTSALAFPPRPTHADTAIMDLFGNKIPSARTVRDAFEGIDKKWHCPKCDGVTEHDLVEVRSSGTVVRCKACSAARELPDKDARNNLLVYESGPAFIERIKKVKQGSSVYDNYSSSYVRLFYDKPARTVKENHGAPFLHPVEDRMISVREMASLQSIPEDYIFTGRGKDIIKLIGNAVPCKMAECLGRMIVRAASLDATSK